MVVVVGGGREPYRRNESEADRLDRNVAELLQELRVVQTGVQILFAFLLTLAFTDRFGRADGYQETVYVITLIFAAVATVLLIAPVAVHRQLFRLGVKDRLVLAADWLAQAGLAALALAVTGSVILIIDVVLTRSAGYLFGAGMLLIFVAFWYGLPLAIRRRRR